MEPRQIASDRMPLSRNSSAKARAIISAGSVGALNQLLRAAVIYQFRPEPVPEDSPPVAPLRSVLSISPPPLA